LRSKRQSNKREKAAMARASRHFIPGYVWHLTHRCHKREFLFKFSRDRDRWLQLLFAAKKRYGVSIFNYMVTSNHIHLVVADNGSSEAIPKTMQYVAGRTGQEYNQRKKRKGAFWQDRYHATAIESGEHLWQCLVYVDLNMVRAGVVKHPSQWKWGGYSEIQNPKGRYRLIDHYRLYQLTNVVTHDDFAGLHRQWMESKLAAAQTRKDYFSRSLAVGSEAFVVGVQEALGARARGRNIAQGPDGGYQLREPECVYAEPSSLLEQGNSKQIDTGNKIPWSFCLS
jgi:putative transposase